MKGGRRPRGGAAPRTLSIGVVGAGVIGRSWALLFAGAGHQVRIFDSAKSARTTVLELIRADLDALGEPPAPYLAHLAVCETLSEAAGGADYIQESAAERLDVKRALAEALGDAAPPHAIIASSASALLPSAIFTGVAGKERMLVAHPFNPPHLLPVVELVASPFTTAATLDGAEAVMRSIGQDPVRVAKEIPGYIGNRLQAAVVAAAMQLVADGAASPDAIDAILRVGLGRRWSFLGPFETMDLNADGGVADYFARFASSYQSLAGDLAVERPWSGPAMEAVVEARRAQIPLDDLPAARRLRDQRLWRMKKEEDEA